MQVLKMQVPAIVEGMGIFGRLGGSQGRPNTQSVAVLQAIGLRRNVEEQEQMTSTDFQRVRRDAHGFY